MQTAPNGQPHCLECMHYHATHIPHLPHGCRAMQFRSIRLPAQEVLETTGLACLAFQPRSQSSGNMAENLQTDRGPHGAP